MRVEKANHGDQVVFEGIVDAHQCVGCGCDRLWHEASLHRLNLLLLTLEVPRAKRIKQEAA